MKQQFGVLDKRGGGKFTDVHRVTKSIDFESYLKSKLVYFWSIFVKIVHNFIIAKD